MAWHCSFSQPWQNSSGLPAEPNWRQARSSVVRCGSASAELLSASADVRTPDVRIPYGAGASTLSAPKRFSYSPTTPLSSVTSRFAA